MKLHAWLVSSLHRLFPLGVPGRNKALCIPAARGERVSFQVGFQLSANEPREVSINVSAHGGMHAFARRIGCVPVLHHNTHTPPEELDGVGKIPGYVPDSLFPETNALFAAGEINGYWITVEVPTDANSGEQNVIVELKVKDGPSIKLKATVLVSKVVLKPRRDFSVTHWFYADAICDWYQVDPWEQAFWPLCEKYMLNYAQHGMDTIYVPVFTPPLDGVKRRTQLLTVHRSGKTYRFDWTYVRQWVKLAQRCGITKFEWTHLFSQWGVKYALRIYEDDGTSEKLFWPAETSATSGVYREFLAQFLPAFKKFLLHEGLMHASFFHVSDEPHGAEALANYRAARALLSELAPWMRVMDALSDIRYGQEGLTDMPVPSIETAPNFHDTGIPSWCYYCCYPRGRYLNRLLDTPLTKVRMSGWLFYHWGFQGFLHWGYNYWYKSQTQQLIDPFTITDGNKWPTWAHGDTFVVYPGPTEIGPIDSIRWEVFAESLQDYALLQTLGVSGDDQCLALLKSFENFPKNEKWIQTTRKLLLK